MILYHLTWGRHLRSIQKLGLLPNYRPNKWWLTTARERSKGKTFLCSVRRRPIWEQCFTDGWAGFPKAKKFSWVWLAVNVDGLNLTRDTGEYRGDYFTVAPIPADRITVHRTILVDREAQTVVGHATA